MEQQESSAPIPLQGTIPTVGSLLSIAMGCGVSVSSPSPNLPSQVTASTSKTPHVSAKIPLIGPQLQTSTFNSPNISSQQESKPQELDSSEDPIATVSVAAVDQLAADLFTKASLVESSQTQPLESTAKEQPSAASSQSLTQLPLPAADIIPNISTPPIPIDRPAHIQGHEAAPLPDLSSQSYGSSSTISNVEPPVLANRKGPQQVTAPVSINQGDAAVGLLYDESMELHYGPEHYERPARIIQVYSELQDQQLFERCWQLVPRRATEQELLRAHTTDHINQVSSKFEQRDEEQKDQQFITSGADLYVCKDTANAAFYAAGCCAEAVQCVARGTVQRALAVVRPPGHHAECERAAGFCFFNNSAVAGLAALQEPGIRRVVILDWDIHHGNGIQDILQQNPEALYISIHRDPKEFYPYHSGFVEEVGQDAGRGFNVNIPWIKKGMGDAEYMAAFDLVVEPILHSYQPDLVIVAAGFDAAEGDPLGGCCVTPAGYGHMTSRLMKFAQGRLVLALEGGYNTRVTAECVAACVRVLLGEAPPSLSDDLQRLMPSEWARKSLKRVFDVQAALWPAIVEQEERKRTFDELWDAHVLAAKLKASNIRPKRENAGKRTTGGSAWVFT